MKRFWLSASTAVMVAAYFVAPVEAQKGKGGGKAGGKGSNATPAAKVNGGKGGNSSQPAKIDSGKGSSSTPSSTQPAKIDGSYKPLPSGPGKSVPARPFAHPKSGNTLPQEIRDKLPPGLRDMPADHPGVANHLRKLGLNDQGVDPIPPEVRSQLPPGLRDKPYNHPGVANHLGKMGWTIGDDGTLMPPPDPIPPQVRRQLPPGLRDKPYDHPGVANHLGKMGWTLGEDGILRPPPSEFPDLFPEFRPFDGFFRRR